MIYRVTRLLLLLALFAPPSLHAGPAVDSLPGFDLPSARPAFTHPKKTRLVTECEQFSKPVEWGYCLSRTEGSQSTDLLYYLHGKGGNKRGWTDRHNFTAVIQDRWEGGGKQAPVVVAISFGKFWLLSEKNPSKDSGLLDFIVDYAMPYIEQKKLGGKIGARQLIGESMGGFNASQLVLKHPELFSRAALVCPALGSLSPYDGKQAVEDYIKRTGARRFNVEVVLRLLKAVFPDDASWQTASPLGIGKTLLGSKTPPLHVSCGAKDEYGFFEGAQAFATLARDKGVDTRWEPLSGGHCAADPAALAAFLVP